MSSKGKARGPVLIANRGEIAIRVARSCKRLGFPTVALYSDADRFSEHAQYCDQAIFVGGSAPKESYLNIESVLKAAKLSGAKYVHPGYGFLSERPQFVEACTAAGLTFVGPSAKSMKQMGDKIEARKTVDSIGVPRVPGSPGVVKDGKEAAGIARTIGYPILLKASAGGGGKGMRRVDNENDLQSAFDGASREALSAFGDGSMYVEKFIVEPHHVEIQVFGDGKGRAIHLGERECSIQRRHQKVWEESPAPILEKFPKTRESMFQSAIKIAEHVQYAGAGTLEFIVDGQGNYYFLEMNTRLQVEHPVTEWVTGVDLVAWQLLLATGELSLPSIPERRGASIEVRFYAEDPHRFLPAPGALGWIQMPSGPFVRTDTAFNGPGEVTVHYDPMIAKISVWAENRADAVGRLRVALDEVRVEPPKSETGMRKGSLKTNLSFLKRLVRNETVMGGDTTTDLIAKNPELTSTSEKEATDEMAIAAALFEQLSENSSPSLASMGGVRDAAPRQSAWQLQSLREGIKG
jgi:acetyl-CoA carboxylase biotin carboxylase subunit